MLESRFRSQIIKACKKAGLNARCTEVPSDPGFPDMLIVNNDRPVFIEFKIHKSPRFWYNWDKKNRYTQINWYREYFKHGNSKLWACFYLDRKTFGLTRITPERLKKIDTMPFKCDTIHSGYKSLIEEFINEKN